MLKLSLEFFFQLHLKKKKKVDARPKPCFSLNRPLRRTFGYHRCFLGRREKWSGREDGDRESLILNPITGFEDWHKKSGKDSSSLTDFLHFKDFPRPLNQKYYGTRYFSRKKKCTCFFRIYTWYRFLFTFLSKKKKGGG